MNITEAAAESLKELKISKNIMSDGNFLRITASQSDSCSFVYRINFIEQNEIRSDDITQNCDDFEIITNEESLPILNVTTLDFVNINGKNTLKFINPNSKCNCHPKEEE